MHLLFLLVKAGQSGDITLNRWRLYKICTVQLLYVDLLDTGNKSSKARLLLLATAIRQSVKKNPNNLLRNARVCFILMEDWLEGVVQDNIPHADCNNDRMTKRNLSVIKHADSIVMAVRRLRSSVEEPTVPFIFCIEL